MLAKRQTLSYRPHRQLWRLSYGEYTIDDYWTIDAFNHLAQLRHTDQPNVADTEQCLFCMKAAMEAKAEFFRKIQANQTPLAG